MHRFFTECPDGGIGRRAGLKHQWIHFHAGSTPALGTLQRFLMKTNSKVYLLLILNIVWMLFIFVLCTLPASNYPKIKIAHLDKVVHFGFFFVQSILLCLLFHYKTNKHYFQIILLSTLFVLVYGGIIEIVQSQFFNRSGEMADLIADVLGGLFGGLVYQAILKHFS